jgi:hypothetical protein
VTDARSFDWYSASHKVRFGSSFVFSNTDVLSAILGHPRFVFLCFPPSTQVAYASFTDRNDPSDEIRRSR